MGQVKRQLVIWGAIVATTAVLPGLALADNASPDFGGHHGGQHGQHGESKLAVAGRALGKAEKNAYGMQIRGRSGDKPTDASGMVRFAHRTAGGAGEGLVGHISCLSKDQAGVVTVTGTIKRGGTRAAKGDKGTRIFLRADKAVPYGEMMEVMNLLRAAGYLKVALVGLEKTP